MEITVKKMYLRVSPRKVRPVLFGIKRKNASEALAILKYAETAVSNDLYSLLKSGIAAYKDQELDTENVFVKNIKCDEGPRLKRRRIVSKGRATAIKKRMCHLTLTLSDEIEATKANNKTKSSKEEVKVEKKEANKAEKAEVNKVEKAPTTTPKADVGVPTESVGKNKKADTAKPKAKKASTKQAKE
ncbi:MAG: 50S ribosomal protein L22 [Patescibacteria group bacterium]|jgi:large subunit ribosomal protein L22